MRWQACSQTNHILWLLICYRTMHNEWRRKEDGFWEWSQSFHVHTTTECLPVSAGCSRILHAANVASAGDCSSLFFSLSHQLLLLFPSPGVITIPLIQLLSNLIWFSPLCRSLFLSVFIQLFHWLADSLFINLMQFAHIHSALSFSSLVVENYWGFSQLAKLSLTVIPQKRNLQFPTAQYIKQKT